MLAARQAARSDKRRRAELSVLDRPNPEVQRVALTSLKAAVEFNAVPDLDS
jgi:hypothetical protein